MIALSRPLRLAFLLIDFIISKGKRVKGIKYSLVKLQDIRGDQKNDRNISDDVGKDEDGDCQFQDRQERFEVGLTPYCYLPHRLGDSCLAKRSHHNKYTRKPS